MKSSYYLHLFSVGVVTAFCLLAGISQSAVAGANDSRALKPMAEAQPTSGKRVALVIGNGDYQYSDKLPKLDNPTHDAEDIARALRGFGFEVIEKSNLSLEGMNEAIAEFGRRIGEGDAALFYFAGHGLQVKGQNYLVPVNANIDSEAQVPYQSVNVNQLLDEMENSRSRANIVMLDACRNNPITGKFRSGATRGLAAPSSSPKGTVIVYATDPGNVAADGNGRNGLFTAGLLAAFKGDDLTLGGVLTRASEEVERGSDKMQTPYVNGPMTLQRRFQFVPAANAPSNVVEATAVPTVIVGKAALPTVIVGSPAPTNAVEASASQAQWTGRWSTNWGEMVLTQNGDTVTGTYTHKQGKINGTVKGNELIGTWSQYPSYAEPNEKGEVVFTLYDKGSSFFGSWRYGTTGTMYGGWTGRKIQ